METANKIILYNDDFIRLDEIRKFIDENFNQEITLKSVSGKFSMSITTLRRRFFSIYSVSVTGYVHRCRMIKAMTLIKEHSLPVSQVAHTVGYNDRSAFTHAFKKFFGISPYSVLRSGSSAFEQINHNIEQMNHNIGIFNHTDQKSQC